MTPPAPDIYLASASPRRGALLEQIGIRYQRVDAETDESRRPGEAPELYVLRLALSKAGAGLAALGARPPRPVLGADTAVVVDADILGKPRDRADALAMLARLSGRSHHVYSGVALVDGGRRATRLSVSTVSFRVLTGREIEAYWAGGEPCDKAGAYGIQGLAARFVSRLEGSYSGVMGLPLYETAELLEEFGIGSQAVTQARKNSA